MKEIIFDQIKAELIQRIREKTQFKTLNMGASIYKLMTGAFVKRLYEEINVVNSLRPTAWKNNTIICICIKDVREGFIHEIDLEFLMPELFEDE